MRAPFAGHCARIFAAWIATSGLAVAVADDAAPKPAIVRSSDPAGDGPSTAPVPPATPAEAERERLAAEARLRTLVDPQAGPKGRATPADKPLVEILKRRLALLAEWKKVAEERSRRPEKTPEDEAAEAKAELEKTRALLDQSTRSPDSLLPEPFRDREKEKDRDGDVKAPEARLSEMKEAIDSARAELKDRTLEFETIRTEGTKGLAERVAALRADRDKVFQDVAAANARRPEHPGLAPGPASPTSADARELAGERAINLDWEARVGAEKLALAEAKIALAARRLDLISVQIQAKAARVALARRLAERMEERYSALAERQRVALKSAVVTEEGRAAKSGDPLERRRAQRSAELLQVEEQVVAYEKAYATTAGVSVQEQTDLADSAKRNFEELKALINDGNVSPLDVLRLKNDFRRIGPERAQVVRTDLAAAEADVTTYENALTESEIDLVNDSRDDRFDREAFLEQIPAARRAEAKRMLDGLEARHKGLLNRRRSVLQKLARRAEDAHNQVLSRIATLDEQYAFIRTHIFWIRDAEPLGASAVAHARDDAIRAAKALARIACESCDRSLWSRPSLEFALVLASCLVLPLPLWLGRRALDRLRFGLVAPGPADDRPPERGIGG